MKYLSKLNSNKRAQVTLFIIVGIIILIISAMFFYLSGKTTKDIGESSVKDSLREKNPVYAFTEECLSQTGIRALKKVGEQGGFVSFDSRFKFNNFKLSEMDGVSLAKGMDVPYWLQLRPPTSCVNCVFENKIPSIEDIKIQLNRYVVDNVNDCLDDFDVFVRQGYIFESGTPIVDFDFAETTVNMKVTFPIKATLGDKTFTALDFIKIYDLPFLKLYDLAVQVALTEQEDLFLERAAMMAISSYSGTPSAERIPPVFWKDQSSKVVRWNVRDVYSRVKESVLSSSINLLQINGSKDFKRLSANNKPHQSYLDGLLVNIPNPSEDFSVKFLYNPDWSIYLDITPRAGAFYLPSTYYNSYLLNLIPDTQDNYYEFFYDLAFPTLVVLHDSSALSEFSNEGYTFIFALEGNVKDNKNLLEWNQGEGTLGSVSYTDNSFDVNIPVRSEGVCDEFDSGKPYVSGVSLSSNKILFKCALDGFVYDSEPECEINCYDEIIENRTLMVDESLFCDSSQRLSESNNIYTFDTYSSDSVDDVSVIFGCGNFNQCFIGSTNPKGELDAKLPVCLNGGFFLFSKNGYIADPIFNVSTQINQPNKINEPLYKIAIRNVSVRYINITNLFIYKRFLQSFADDLIDYEREIKTAILKNSFGVSDQIRTNLARVAADLFDSFLKMNLLSFPGDDEDGKRDAKLRKGFESVMNLVVDLEDLAISVLSDMPVLDEVSGEDFDNYFTIAEQDLLLAELGKNFLRTEIISLILNSKDNYGQVSESDAQVFRTFAGMLMDEMAFLSDNNFIQSMDSIIARSDWDKLIFAGSKRDFSDNSSLIRESLKNVHFLNSDELNDSEIVNKYRFDSKELESGFSVVVSINRLASPFASRLPKSMTRVSRVQKGEIAFVPGNFLVSAQLLSNESILIPEFSLSDSNFSQVLDEVKIDAPTLIGGSLFDENFPLIVDESIYDSDELVLYVFRYDTPVVHQDLAEIAKFKDYSKKFRAIVEPEFK